MPDSKAKTEWERENVVSVLVKVNRNQDPKLFDLLKKAESKSSAARKLMRAAVKGH